MHHRVRAMASIHLDTLDVDWSLNEFRGFRQEGYEIVKGGWGKEPGTAFGLNRKHDLELAHRIREIIGDDIDLVFDILGARVKWTLQSAKEWFHELSKLRLRWIEEPLPPQDFAAHALLHAAVTTRIGTGEQEWTPEGYRRLIDSGGVDVVQMDPGRCLGITGCLKVIAMIESKNLTFSMHSWSTAINTAASVHLLGSSLQAEAMDFKPHESPMQHELVSDPWEAHKGWVEVRKAPGLGIEVRETIVSRYTFA
jgi:L-alanine-DL-glutamate epimerase-like enolase superfamily enzyme